MTRSYARRRSFPRPRSVSRSQSLWLLAAVAVFAMSEQVEAQQPPVDTVRFAGTTSLYQEYKDSQQLSAKEAFYEPLEKVQVNAFGPGVWIPKVSEMKMINKRMEAFYEMQVPAGPPVRLLFYYLPQQTTEDYVPTLKCLTADNTKPQLIHVVMLTREQYIRFYSQDILIDDMQRLLKILEQMIETGEINADEKGRLRSLAEYIRGRLLKR